MRGFSFLITWLVFGIPSSAIAVGIGCFLHLSAITIAVLVVAIEAIEQMYVALASVVNLTVGWLNTTKAYEDLRMLFKSIDDVY